MLARNRTNLVTHTLPTSTTTLENSQILLKLKMNLPYDPAFVLLGIYPRETKIYFYTRTCTQIFIVALFVIVPKGKLPKYPSVDEQLNKLWSIHTMKYSLTTKNKPLILRTTWMNLKEIMLSEKSQSQKDTYHMVPFM